MDNEANPMRQHLVPDAAEGEDHDVWRYRREICNKLGLKICTCLAAALIVIAVLYGFTMKTPPPEVESKKTIAKSKVNEDIYHEFNPEIVHLSNPFGLDLWRHVFNLSQVQHLHFNVGDKNLVLDPKSGKIKGEFFGETLKISGRPSFFTEDKPKMPQSMLFENVTTLELSSMAICHHYFHTILGKWRYPVVTHLKMRKVLIRQKEFAALRKFIQVHNQTLTKVEIDEGFFCSRRVCDVGKLNFPNHDFEIIITRRKEVSEWI